MDITFEQFIAGFNTPPPKAINMDSEPVEVLTYIKHHGHLKANLDFLDDYLLKVTPENPDEWEYDEDCVGEIEFFRDQAEQKQELEEIEWEAAANNPDHPRHEEVMKELYQGADVDACEAVDRDVENYLKGEQK